MLVTIAVYALAIVATVSFLLWLAISKIFQLYGWR